MEAMAPVPTIHVAIPKAFKASQGPDTSFSAVTFDSAAAPSDSKAILGRIIIELLAMDGAFSDNEG